MKLTKWISYREKYVYIYIDGSLIMLRCGCGSNAIYNNKKGERKGIDAKLKVCALINSLSRFKNCSAFVFEVYDI